MVRGAVNAAAPAGDAAARGADDDGLGEPKPLVAALWYGWAAFLVGIDQVSKRTAEAYLAYGEEVDVLPFLSWKLLYNPGMAFSLFAQGGSWQRWVFSAVALGFSAFLVNEIRKLGRGFAWLGFAYGCILAGALGNLADRAISGHVIDFVFVHYGWFRFPVFNVADAAVTVGAGVWIALMLLDTLAARRGN